MYRVIVLLFVAGAYGAHYQPRDRYGPPPSEERWHMDGHRRGMTWAGFPPMGVMTYANVPRDLVPPAPATVPERHPPVDEENQLPQNYPQNYPDRKSPSKPTGAGQPGSSNAHATVNAWFPIVIRGYEPERKPSRDNSGVRSVMAVANSVNHGGRGVATSHAVAFGGDNPFSRSRSQSGRPHTN